MLKIVRGKRISGSWAKNLLTNHFNSMDSIVRSCKILVPQLHAGRLILDGCYYCVFVLLCFNRFFFVSNKKEDYLQIVVARFRLRDVSCIPFVQFCRYTF